MASSFHMLWKAGYLFIFSQFFCIILMFFHFFFQFATSFTCILFLKIITVYFIICTWSFHFILLFCLYFSSFSYFVKTVLNPYLLSTLLSFSPTPFLYGMNICTGSISLLFCSELSLCKVYFIVLLITFNGYPFCFCLYVSS